MRSGSSGCRPATGAVSGKRTFPNELYSVPLRDVTGEQVIAQKLANLYPLPRNVPEHEKLYGKAAPYQGMPTGMSLRGNKLLVTTYRDAYLYDVRDVAKEPKNPLPLAGQREGIAFVGNSKQLPTFLVNAKMAPR